MDDTIETSVFDTAGLATSERFSAWREGIGFMFEVELPSESDAATFSARMESLLLGDIMLSRSVASAQRFIRDQHHILQDSLDHYMFQVFDRGHVDMKLGSDTIRGQKGMMIAGDMAEPLNSKNSDYSLISVFVPRRLLDPHLSEVGMVHGATIPTGSGPGRLLADYMRSLERFGPKLDQAGAKAASDALVILIAAACNDARVNMSDPPDWANPSLLLRIRGVIIDNLRNPDLSVDDIAAQCGLSRSRLYTLVQRHGGVMHIVREQRLKHALRDLVSKQGLRFSISEIAYRWGFSTPAQFARAFRTRFGCSPREVRGHGRMIAAHRQSHDLAGIGDRKFETWIDTLG